MSPESSKEEIWNQFLERAKNFDKALEVADELICTLNHSHYKFVDERNEYFKLNKGIKRTTLPNRRITVRDIWKEYSRRIEEVLVSYIH